MRVCDILRSTPLAKIDAELLLVHALRSTRTAIYAHPEKLLSKNEIAQYRRYEKRRQKHEPVAYILGQCEWYGRRFMVKKGVLIPRPATEAIIGATLDLLRHASEQTFDTDTSIVIMSRFLRKSVKPTRITDIGTGTGCIAVTLALESDIPSLDAVDCSRVALRIAEKNILLHDVSRRVRLIHGDGIDAIECISEPFLIVSNPPYIPEGTTLMKDVQCEPKAALFSGNEGDTFLKNILGAAFNHPLCAGIVLECMDCQRENLDAMIAEWRSATV